MTLLYLPTPEDKRKAIAQAIGIAACVYQDRRETLSSWLLPESEILLWYETERWFRPRLCVLRQYPFTYYIGIEGTMGFSQASWQGGPLNLLLNRDTEGFAPGAFYAQAGNGLFDVVRPFIPVELNTTTLIISGHSMGGAVGLILAERFIELMGPDRVNLVTLGQPKTVATGWNGFQPENYVRAYSSGDLVPQYPGDSNSWVLTQLATPSSWVPGLNRWGHYGDAVPINYLGQFATNPAVLGPIPKGVKVGDWVEHGLENYAARIRAYEESQPVPDPVVRSAVNLAFSALDSATEYRVDGPFIDQMGLPEKSEAALAFRLGMSWLPQFSFGGGGVATIKHTWLFFDQRGANWTETYWMTADSARTSFTPLTEAVISSRLGLLFSGCILRSIRAAEQGGNRTTSYRILNLQGVADVKGDGGTPDVTSTAAIFDIRGVSGGSRKVWIRGLWDNDVERSVLSGNDKPSARLLNAATAWFTSAASIGYAIQYRSKPGGIANTDYREAMGVDGSAGTGLTTITVSDPTGYSKNGRIALSLFNDKQLPRINGEFTILNVVGTSVSIQYRTPGDLNYPSAGGRVRLIVPRPLATIDPAQCTFDHFGSRQTKSDFTRSRGSRRAARTRLSGSTAGQE